MSEDTTLISEAERFMKDVRAHLSGAIDGISALIPPVIDAQAMVIGKLMRTEWLSWLAATQLPGFDRQAAIMACAATELAHSASLCHDDVIDGADMRRGAPTVWKKIGVAGGILVGDVLIFLAYEVVANIGNADVNRAFAKAALDVIRGEIAQEMQQRGRPSTEHDWVEICKAKTGVLYGLAGRAAFHDDPELAAAACAAGSLIGAARQMYDDFVDLAGDAAAAGKTLGTDLARGKLTLPATRPDRALEILNKTLAEAATVLERWAGARQAIERYIADVIRPRMHDVQALANQIAQRLADDRRG